MFVVTCGLVSPETMENEQQSDIKRTLADVHVAYDSEGHKRRKRSSTLDRSECHDVNRRVPHCT